MDGESTLSRPLPSKKLHDACWPEGMRYSRSAAYFAEAQRDPAERPCAIRLL